MANMAAPMAAAELMVHAGSNVITIENGGWDTHGDRDGSTVRNMMNQRIYAGVRTFINRMMVQKLAGPEVNVTLVIGGDFSRSLPGSDHATVLSATVIGNSIKAGTTGAVTPQVGLQAGTGGWTSMWSLLADIAKLPTNPFGTNAAKGTLLR
jgi:uncharacterized protein (DUF1501 family)